MTITNEPSEDAGTVQDPDTLLAPPSLLVSPANLARMLPACPSKPLINEVNRTEAQAS